MRHLPTLGRATLGAVALTASAACADAPMAPMQPTHTITDGFRSASFYAAPHGGTRIVYSEHGAIVGTVYLSTAPTAIHAGTVVTVLPARGKGRSVTLTAADLQSQRPPLAVNADILGPDCGGYVRATLLSLGSMVVMAAIDNPLGFFLGALAVANGVYDYAKCSEAT